MSRNFTKTNSIHLEPRSEYSFSLTPPNSFTARKNLLLQIINICMYNSDSPNNK